MMALCTGLGARVVWTDGTGIAACGSPDEHGPHTFTRTPPPCTCADHPRRVDPACPLTLYVNEQARIRAAAFRGGHLVGSVTCTCDTPERHTPSLLAPLP